MIVISSIAAVTGRKGPAGLLFNDGYAAANRAVNSLTETWAKEGAPEVRVNEIMLGFLNIAMPSTPEAGLSLTIHSNKRLSTTPCWVEPARPTIWSRPFSLSSKTPPL